MENFSDRLTPKQIGKVLDALNISWRSCEPNADGWINPTVNGATTYGINLQHGGYVDHSGDKGDLVSLVTVILDCSKSTAIREIQKMLKKVVEPDLDIGSEFATDHLKKNSGNPFVRIPITIMECDAITGNEKIVWGAIFDRCGSSKYAYPGTRRICQDTGLSRPTVLRAIKNLIDYGFIIEKKRGSNPNLAPSRFPVIPNRGQEPLPRRGKDLNRSWSNIEQAVVKDLYHNQIKEPDPRTKLNKPNSKATGATSELCTIFKDDLSFKRVDCSPFSMVNPSGELCQYVPLIATFQN